jgi:hypothetical protein
LLDLVEMMAYMRDVVLDQSAQSDSGIGADPTWHLRCGIWDPSNHVRQMMVVENPEIDELKPGPSLIILQEYPSVLFISWE